MIKSLFKNSLSLFSQKQTTILSAAFVIMLTVMLSRVLGLLRDRLLANYFSVEELGIYFAAFRLPNLLFEILVMGALSTAFIPVFTQVLNKNNEEEAFRLGSTVINLGSLAMLILLIPLCFFAKEISYLIVPKFSSTEREQMVVFTQIMLIGQAIPLVLGNFVTGMLQSLKRFLIPALAPVVYNLGIIVGVILLVPFFGLYAAVWGVVIGALLYLLIQLPLLWRLGFRHRMVFDYHNTYVKDVLHLMLPRTFGLAVSQIDTTVDLVLASFLGTRSITIFNFAQHLQQLPIGLFGTTFAQAALPTLSAEATNKDLTVFKNLIISAIQQILFFVIPASVILIVLRIPIVRLVFGAARFDWEATVVTGQTLMLFAVSIFAQSLVQLFARGFYALSDSKTPVVIGVVCVILNTILSIVFVYFLNLPVWSLALSTSIASIVNAFLLFVYLNQKTGGFNLKPLFVTVCKILLVSSITGISLYLPMKLFDQLIFDTTRVLDLLILTGIALFSGLSVYIFLAWVFNIEEVGMFRKLLQKTRPQPQLVPASTDELVNEEQTSIP